MTDQADNGVVAGARRKKSEDRREEILQKAAACFDARGYANTSLDDIAQSVGIRREAIYYYFKNRSQILLEIIEPQSIALVEGITAIVDDQKMSPEDKFRAAIRNHLERFDRYCLEMTVSMRGALYEAEPAVLEMMTNIWDDYESKWAQLIKEGQSQGAFRRIGNPKMIAFAVLGTCNWLARWYDPKKSASIEELIESYTDLLTNGMLQNDTH